MKLLFYALFFICLAIYLIALGLDRAGVKARKKKRPAYSPGFVGYDQLSYLEKDIFDAIHALRYNGVLWKGSPWQMIAWNTVCDGDGPAFRELCRQLVSEGDKAPADMEAILGGDLWEALLKYRNKNNVFYLHRKDHPVPQDALSYEANNGVHL